MSIATIPESEQTEPITRPSESVPSVVTLRVRPLRVALALLLVVICLAIASTASRQLMTVIDGDTYRGVRELAYRIDLDRENTLPSWFSSLLLFASAAAAGVIWRIRRQRQGPFVWHWAILAAVFVYLSLDESAVIHEILIIPLRRRANWRGVLYFAWVIPGSVLVVGFLLAYFRFWWRLPRGIRARVFIAATLYIGGALGMELVGGAFADAYGMNTLSYTIVMTIEESLEMVGSIVFLSALLELIRREAPLLRLQWLPPAPQRQFVQ